MRTLSHIYRSSHILKNFIASNELRIYEDDLLVQIFGSTIEFQDTENIKKTIKSVLPKSKIIDGQIINSNNMENKITITFFLFAQHDLLDSFLEQKITDLQKKNIGYIKAYQDFIDDMTDGVLLFDKANTIIYANKRMIDIGGYSLDYIIGKSILDFLDQKSKEIVLDNLKKNKDGQKNIYFLDIINKQGQKVPLRVMSQMFVNGTKIAIIRDLREIETLRIKNEELEESHARYRAVVEDQTELIARYSKDGTISFANNSFCEYFEINATDIVGQNFYEIMENHGIAGIYGVVETLSNKNPVKSFQSKGIFPGGNGYRLEWTVRAIFDKRNRLIEYQSVGRDITDMIFMEQKIQSSKEEYFNIYKTIIDNMSEFVWIGDQNHRTVYVNPKYREVLGYSLEEIQGRDIYALWDEDVQVNMKNINRNIASNNQYKGEGIIISKAGEFIPVHIDKKPFVDGGLVLIMTDLREIKKMKQKTQQLEEMNKAKDEFISVASHELRTPMTSIKGYVSMLLEGDFGKLPEEAVDVINIIRKSTTRQIDLINDMLNIAKLESGKAEFRPTIFLLTEVVDEFMDEYRPIAKSHGLQFVLENNAPETKLNLDKNKLTQILINLVGNAIKFTPRGGKIFLKINPSKNNRILIEVVDTGIGIDEKDFDKVFTKFQQVHSALIRNYSGTGLGVPISKNILENFGSKLNLKSKLGEGSNFYFELDIYKN